VKDPDADRVPQIEPLERAGIGPTTPVSPFKLSLPPSFHLQVLGSSSNLQTRSTLIDSQPTNSHLEKQPSRTLGRRTTLPPSMYFTRIISVLAAVAVAAALNLPTPPLPQDHHSVAATGQVGQRDNLDSSTDFCWCVQSNFTTDDGRTSTCCQIANGTYDGTVSTLCTSPPVILVRILY